MIIGIPEMRLYTIAEAAVILGEHKSRLISPCAV
jgi:hypothetical protein